ncbi:hypothetical protein [Luteithermobacter gelatinilyticus]|uniref:hypothetical protein n=1 Tax=Luteithermobacter gelatinilyticus TaxID=2582913 RepID=UPI0011071765|nr:hypothetical protein [Luteithermobacter gelatinilyticus]|tara:strand:+ start:239 stop:460 length:222 start_codon:yes stop_codon:yes gene_type:complete
MNRYEVALYNQDVREAYADGRKHPNYGPEWGDLRYLEVEAETEEEALKLIRKHHPERQGFIIRDVILIKEFVE